MKKKQKNKKRVNKTKNKKKRNKKQLGGGATFGEFLINLISGKLPKRQQKVLGERGINKTIQFNMNQF